jgi:hypothetical protein
LANADDSRAGIPFATHKSSKSPFENSFNG